EYHSSWFALPQKSRMVSFSGCFIRGVPRGTCRGEPVLKWGFTEQSKEPAVREGIHPKYHEVEARCACGATWKTRSTKNELHLEICSNCHPFFTGRQKLIDTEGRVERFTKKFGAQTSESRKKAAKIKKETPAAAR